MITREYLSPCGSLMLGVSDSYVCLCDWIRGDRVERSLSRIDRHREGETLPDDNDLLDMAIVQLDEYFARTRRDFDLPLRPLGTEFQLHVWNALFSVDYGQTATYGDISIAVGQPASVRAVANAIGANSLSLFIPCHRIIGADGSLTGYAGGLEAKKYLLELERG